MNKKLIITVVILSLLALGVRHMTKDGLRHLKVLEGGVFTAYQDAVGVWTIGYGSTDGVKEGMEISQERAEMLLLEDVEVFEESVNKLVEVPLEQNQFDALVSWTFNLGSTNLKNSTLLKVLNDKDYEGVPAQIKRWNKAGGKVLQGLIRRREAEALLFEGKEWHEV